MPIPIVRGKERSRTKKGRWRKTRTDKGVKRTTNKEYAEVSAGS